MKSEFLNIDQYVEQLPEDRKEAINKLRIIFKENLPQGFTEVINYGMIGYVVPHTIYPKGYHTDPKLPLPFINIASQKSHIAIYHMGLYADNKLFDWFIKEYPKFSKSKPDIGKSCIRFKNPKEIPFELIALLSKKITVSEWVDIYESAFQK